MINKCPKCDAVVTYVNMESIDIHYQLQPRWKGISYLCPLCQSILAIQIDPVALNTDLLKEIANVLQEKKRL